MVLLSRFGVLCATLWLFGFCADGLWAQTAPETPPPASPPANTPPVKSPPPQAAAKETPSQPELLNAYLQLRNQLRAAQQAITDNRVASEAAARTQAAALSAKLDAIQSQLAAERQRQQLEAQQRAAEREREQADAQRANRTLLWLASAIGGLGLLAILLTTVFQWRAIVRIAEGVPLHPQLPAASRLGLLAENAATRGEAVALSTQRLLTVIDRLEGRIAELEHTAHHPLPATSATPADGPEAAPRAAPADQTMRVTALLGKGWSLYNRNRLNEAVAAYNELLRLDPNNPDALVRKGLAFEKLKKDLDALECYDLALKADPKLTIAYLNKGRVCNRLERYDEALECYEQALPTRAATK